MSKQTSTVHAPKVGRGLAICLRDVVSEFADGQRVSTGKASVVIEIRGGWSIKTKSYIKIEFVQGSRILIKMNKAAKNKPEKIVTTLISGDLRVELILGHVKSLCVICVPVTAAYIQHIFR